MASKYALQHAEYPMSMVDSTTDETLMEQLGGGDDDALAELVRRYQQDVFRFCLHYLKNVEVAKEMAQETFLRVYTARERFDVTKRFKPWMLCIARNLCLNEIKRKKTVQMETLEEYATSARGESGEMLRSSADGASELLQAAERRDALLQALEELPEESREIVKLRYFEKLSAREIADIVESTEGAIRTRLHRILKQLREVFEPQRADL